MARRPWLRLRAQSGTDTGLGRRQTGAFRASSTLPLVLPLPLPLPQARGRKAGTAVDEGRGGRSGGWRWMLDGCWTLEGEPVGRQRPESAESNRNARQPLVRMARLAHARTHTTQTHAMDELSRPAGALLDIGYWTQDTGYAARWALDAGRWTLDTGPAAAHRHSRPAPSPVLRSVPALAVASRAMDCQSPGLGDPQRLARSARHALLHPVPMPVRYCTAVLQRCTSPLAARRSPLASSCSPRHLPCSLSSCLLPPLKARPYAAQTPPISPDIADGQLG